MTIRLRIIALGLTVICAQPASAQKITTEFDHAVDFSTFKTFAIAGSELRSPSPALNSELTKKRVDDQIERALIGKGLTKATGRPDLNVFYTLGSIARAETERYPAGRRGRATRVVRSPSAEANLIVDVRDPTTHALVWRGIATDTESEAARLVGKLDDMVKKVIEKFPSRK